MKLIKQTQLYFQNEKSDKVYEVDLCETTSGLFLVNFRYGRRGQSLREGTKTDQPVELFKAEKIFDKLVAEKTKKGYLPLGTPVPTTTPPAPVVIDDTIDTTSPEPIPVFELKVPVNKEYAILKALEETIQSATTTADPNRYQRRARENRSSSSSGTIWDTFKNIVSGQNTANNQDTPRRSARPNPDIHHNKKYKPSRSGRKIERLVWRVGELRLRSAISLLLTIDPTNNPMLAYALAWAVGRCEDKSAAGYLENLRRHSLVDEKLNRMIKEARMPLLDEPQRKELADNFKSILPTSLQSNLDDPTMLSDVLLTEGSIGEAARANLPNLYLLSEHYPAIRSAILIFIEKMPLTGSGYFKGFRGLFKSAEFRDDAELYGKLAYKIQKTPGNFLFSKWGGTYVGKRWVRINEEIGNTNSKIGYSVQTKNYLERRVARLLNRKGLDQDPAYIKMAVGILLAYSDQDKLETRSETFYKYRRNASGRWESIREVLNYTPYAPYLAFNQILFSNSPRVEMSKGRNQWLYKSNQVLVNSSTVREEAFPELWDKMPQGLLHLLAESKSEAVHDFAIKAARANHRKIIGLINTDFVTRLLKSPYKNTVEYGITLARSVYSSENPDFSLIQALLKCPVLNGRLLGLAWIKAQENTFLQNDDFLVQQYFNTYPEVQEWLKNLKVDTVLSDQKAVTIIAKCIGKMINYTSAATAEDKAGILSAGDLLTQHFPKELYHTSFKLINGLLHHPLPEVSVFGAKILQNHQTPIEELPEELLLGLINGDSPELRQSGVTLLGKMPDHRLKNKIELLTSLAVSQYPEVRKAVYPIIKKIADTDLDFGKIMSEQLVPQLLSKENHEGRDEDLIDFLLSDFNKHLHHVSTTMVLNLLYSNRKAAHELGYFILKDHVDGNELTIRQIVKLGSNELIAVRRWVWEYYNNQVPRIKEELAESVRLLDARWDDSRDFTIQYLNENLDENDWNPDVLISICDSVHPVVQQYGQNRITQFFDEKDGEKYLLQLSQHPSTALQHFATNYLDRFAADKPENIAALERYFVTILSGVNKSSVAKKRIFDFVHKEGLKNQTAAQVAASVISRQSATMAITDKARCIEIMRDLKRVYREIELPIVKKDFREYRIENSNKF